MSGGACRAPSRVSRTRYALGRVCSWAHGSARFGLPLRCNWVKGGQRVRRPYVSPTPRTRSSRQPRPVPRRASRSRTFAPSRRRAQQHSSHLKRNTAAAAAMPSRRRWTPLRRRSLRRRRHFPYQAPARDRGNCTPSTGFFSVNIIKTLYCYFSGCSPLSSESRRLNIIPLYADNRQRGLHSLARCHVYCPSTPLLLLVSLSPPRERSAQNPCSVFGGVDTHPLGSFRLKPSLFPVVASRLVSNYVPTHPPRFLVQATPRLIQLGRSGPNLEPRSVRAYVINGARNGLHIDGKVGPCPRTRRRWVWVVFMPCLKPLMP